MRKNYLDNIRFATVVLVVIYHVAYLYNNLGVFGSVGTEKCFEPANAILYFVYPWFMVLLFLIAGISTRYALAKRTAKEFMKERAGKLLVPSVLGLFVIHWITGYLNIYIGGGLAMMPSFLVYPISVLSGIGPLWFIQLLFVFSVLLVLIRKIDKKDVLWQLGGRVNIVIVFLLFLVVWGASQLLNTPLITVYRFGIYFTAYLMGYLIFSHEEVMEKVEKIRLPMLIGAVITGVAYTIYYWGRDYTTSECLQGIFTNFYLWIAVLAILGCGKHYFNQSNAITQYMSKASFGIYVLHYPVFLAICYFLYAHCNLPFAVNYIIAIVVGFGLTILLYEVIRRIPVIRYLVLGIRRKM